MGPGRVSHDHSWHRPWDAHGSATGTVRAARGRVFRCRNIRCIAVITAMLLASLSFRAQPHKRAEALSAVDSLVQRMRGSTGCARTRILIDTEDANAFLIASEWSDHEAAEAFFTSREFQIFRGVRILMRDEPLIVLDDVRSRITRLLRN